MHHSESWATKRQKLPLKRIKEWDLKNWRTRKKFLEATPSLCPLKLQPLWNWTRGVISQQIKDNSDQFTTWTMFSKPKGPKLPLSLRVFPLKILWVRISTRDRKVLKLNNQGTTMCFIRRQRMRTCSSSSLTKSTSICLLKWAAPLLLMTQG